MFISVLSVTGVVVLTYLTAYLYLIFTNVDATRSERFTLEKIALQQSKMGDDKTGFGAGAHGQEVSSTPRRIIALSEGEKS